MSGSRRPGRRRTRPLPVSDTKSPAEAAWRKRARPSLSARPTPGSAAALTPGTVRHLDHDAVRVLEPVDEVGLERPAPGEELLREVAGDAGGGMNAKVAAERGMAHAAPGEEPRRVDRARGDHDQRGANPDPAVRGVAVAL